MYIYIYVFCLYSLHPLSSNGSSIRRNTSTIPASVVRFHKRQQLYEEKQESGCGHIKSGFVPLFQHNLLALRLSFGT